MNANDEIILTVIISDANTGLDAALKTFLPNTKHIHCIFHICQNLDCHIQNRQKLYSTHNNLNEAIFEIRWNQLIEAFSSTGNYLIGTLDKIKESWVKAFVCMVNTKFYIM